MRSMPRLLIIASSLVALASIATPAMAICKYGTPHCINKHPGPSLPEINTNRLPDSPGDDDCKYYGSCDDGSPEGTGPDGGPNGGLGTDTGGPWSPALVSSGGQVHLLPGLFAKG